MLQLLYRTRVLQEISGPCRSPAPSFVALIEAEVRKPAARTPGDDNAIHGDGEGEQGLRSWRAARREDPDRDGEVQRGAGEGGGDAGRRGPPCELQGSPRPVRREQEDGHRRSVRGDEGAGGRLLALAGEVEGRGDRVAQARPVPGGRGGDPAGVRDGGLRPGGSERQGPRAGRPAPQEDRAAAAAPLILLCAGGRRWSDWPRDALRRASPDRGSL